MKLIVESLIANGSAIPFTAHATSPTITMPRQSRSKRKSVGLLKWKGHQIQHQQRSLKRRSGNKAMLLMISSRVYYSLRLFLRYPESYSFCNFNVCLDLVFLLLKLCIFILHILILGTEPIQTSSKCYIYHKMLHQTPSHSIQEFWREDGPNEQMRSQQGTGCHDSNQ